MAKCASFVSTLSPDVGGFVSNSESSRSGFMAPETLHRGSIKRPFVPLILASLCALTAYRGCDPIER
jgi:hypothetical protein